MVEIVINFIYLVFVNIIYRIFGFEVTMLTCAGIIMSQSLVNELRVIKLNDKVDQLYKEKKANVKRYRV